MDLVTVYVTAPDVEVARRIARAALDAKAAACANILRAHSLYDWEGARVEEDEVVMLLKTTREAAPRLVELVRANHPYQVPCIEVLPVLGTHWGYARWVTDGVSR